MDEGWKEDYEALPKAGSHRLIDFEQASVVTDRPPHFFRNFSLLVEGSRTRTCGWISRRWCASDGPSTEASRWWDALPGDRAAGRRIAARRSAKAQYNATIPLYSGLTGTEGIEIMGATRSERIEVQHDQPAGECSDWHAWRNLEPPGPVILHVTGECKFPDDRYKVELRQREPQRINPKDLLLELIVTEERGWTEPVEETTLEARYEEQTDFEYDTVTILPDGAVIPVKEVH